MHQLHRQAMASVPLSKETVQSFYDGTRFGATEQCLKALCESHERLRAELEGSELLRQDAENDVKKLEAAKERLKSGLLRLAARCEDYSAEDIWANIADLLECRVGDLP